MKKIFNFINSKWIKLKWDSSFFLTYQIRKENTILIIGKYVVKESLLYAAHGDKNWYETYVQYYAKNQKKYWNFSIIIMTQQMKSNFNKYKDINERS